MGATVAREAARERMVREAASGRGRRGRQHCYSTAGATAPAGGGGGDACDGRYDDGANGEDGGSEEGGGVADHTCN